MTMTFDDQRMRGLARANAVRAANVQLARDLRRTGHDMQAARILVAEILEGCVEGMPVGALSIGRLLLMMPWFGTVKARRVIADAGVFSFDRRVRDLTCRQRNAVARQLRGDA